MAFEALLPDRPQRCVQGGGYGEQEMAKVRENATNVAYVDTLSKNAPSDIPQSLFLFVLRFFPCEGARRIN